MLQFSANSITGLTGVVQITNNLLHPVWVSILVNDIGADATVNFQTSFTNSVRQFFRLAFR
jgi:hypothetical protein